MTYYIWLHVIQVRNHKTQMVISSVGTYRVHCFSPTLRDRARASGWLNDNLLSEATWSPPEIFPEGDDGNFDPSGARWMASSSWKGRVGLGGAAAPADGDGKDVEKACCWSAWSLDWPFISSPSEGSASSTAMETAIIGGEVVSDVSYFIRRIENTINMESITSSFCVRVRRCRSPSPLDAQIFQKWHISLW